MYKIGGSVGNQISKAVQLLGLWSGLPFCGDPYPNGVPALDSSGVLTPYPQIRPRFQNPGPSNGWLLYDSELQYKFM